MAPQVGLEPTTLRLTAGCSAIELLRSGSALTCALELSIKSYQRLLLMGNLLISAFGRRGWREGVSLMPRFCSPNSQRFVHNRSEVFMLGGSRLLTAFLVLLIGVVALVYAEDSRAGDSTAPSATSGPPKAKVAPVEDTVQGHKIVDRYRYLENPNDPDTKLYVEQELGYTRAILDPLPGRDKINARLSQLLEIGTVGA